MSFFNELKRRNVVRMALLYIIAGWLVLQIADVLFEPLGLPDWSFRLVLGLLLLGLPLALIFAWIFELTPEGLKRERDIDRSQSVVQQTGRKMNTVIVVLLVIAIGGLVADRLVPESAPPAAEIAGEAAAPAPTVAAEPEAEPEAAEASIAVLPFVNMSGDQDNEYFSDGLTEELLNTLVRIGGLKVTGRTSSFAFKGENRDLREIGRLLNVANVLEGSVRKAGNRVRITAQLVKTTDGYHIWSDTFDRELTDIFAIQQEIAEQVTRALRDTLLGDSLDEVPVIALTRHDPVAYEEYLRGMYVLQSSPDNRAELERAQGHFAKALAIDPDYVAANWGMFYSWDQMNRNGHGSFQESLARMGHYATELQRIAPTNDRTLSAAARMALVNYRYEEGTEYLAQAVRQNPGNARVLGEYASALSTLNRYEDALRAIEQASQLDPLSLEIMRWKSFIYHRTGECELAEQLTRRALEMDPEIGRFRYYLAMCIYETSGDVERALPLAEAEPLNWARNTSLAILYGALGDMGRAQQQLKNMIESHGDAAAYQYAQVYTQLGDLDQALYCLERAVEIGDPGILQAAHDRLFTPLHGNPRYEQVLRDTRF